MLDYLNHLAGVSPLELATAAGTAVGALWALNKAARGLWSAGAALARLFAPRPSELCRELLAALDGEAVYDPADRGGQGSLCTDGALVAFGEPPRVETADGDGCHYFLSKRDLRRVLRKAEARRDAIVTADAERAERLRLAEVRRGRAGGGAAPRAAAAERFTHDHYAERPADGLGRK